MITNLTELHDQVHKRSSRVSIPNVGSFLQKIRNRDVGKQCLVKGALASTEVDINIDFDLQKGQYHSTELEGCDEMYLITKFVLNMTLHSTQHEGFQDHVQPPKLVLIQLTTLVLRSVLDDLRKPLVELIMRVEQTRHNEMQQGP